MYEEILRLRKSGKSFGEISKVTGKSKSTVRDICKRFGLGGRSDGKIEFPKDKVSELNEYYKTHTKKETADFFEVSESVVKYHVDKKITVHTEDEKKIANYKHVKNFRQKNKERAVNYKGGKCEKCGYNKCITALEFHHTDPKEKDFHISSNMNKAWDKVKKELDKCILVCSNCHREIHYDLIYDTAHIPSV
jgi:DNA-binding CsgD family transcriptional regulator